MSCTELIISIAPMQLIERGTVSLNDSAIIARHFLKLCPRKVVVKFENPIVPYNELKPLIFKEREGGTIPWMLLTQMYGIGPSLFDASLKEVFGPG